MTMNSATSVSFENENEWPRNSTVPIPTQNALMQPISSAARNAPGMLPMPPTTTTTNASEIAPRSRKSCAGSRGIWRAPPKPASSAPSANTPVKSHFWFTPSAPTISRSSVAARISVPQRVRLRSSQSAPSTSGPTAIRKRSYSGNAMPRMSTEPRRPGARGPSRSSAPQIQSARSLMTSVSAKVASSWKSSGAW